MSSSPPTVEDTTHHFMALAPDEQALVIKTLENMQRVQMAHRGQVANEEASIPPPQPFPILPPDADGEDQAAFETELLQEVLAEIESDGENLQAPAPPAAEKMQLATPFDLADLPEEDLNPKHVPFDIDLLPDDEDDIEMEGAAPDQPPSDPSLLPCC